MKSHLITFRQLIILICFNLLLSACVSSKKYKDAVASNDQLKIQNQQLTQQNQSLETQMADQKSKYSSYQGECETIKKDCEKAQAELNHIHEVVNEQERILMQVKEKISVALADFIDKGVYAEYRDGLVYVRLQDDLLY